MNSLFEYILFIKGHKMNIMKMMKDVTQIQDRLKEARAKLEEIEVSGQAGGGMVSVTMNAKMRLLSIDIDQALIDQGDKNVINDLIIAASDIAREKAKEQVQVKMNEATGGLPIPGLADLGF